MSDAEQEFFRKAEEQARKDAGAASAEAQERQRIEQEAIERERVRLAELQRQADERRRQADEQRKAERKAVSLKQRPVQWSQDAQGLRWASNVIGLLFAAPGFIIIVVGVIMGLNYMFGSPSEYDVEFHVPFLTKLLSVVTVVGSGVVTVALGMMISHAGACLAALVEQGNAAQEAKREPA